MLYYKIIIDWYREPKRCAERNVCLCLNVATIILPRSKQIILPHRYIRMLDKTQVDCENIFGRWIGRRRKYPFKLIGPSSEKEYRKQF